MSNCKAIFCSVPEAAKMLGVGKSTIYGLLEKQAFRSVKIGKRRIVEIESLRAYAENLMQEAA